MLNIIGTSKDYTFDDVILTDYLDTDCGSFSLEQYYIGGLDENEYLEGSLCCHITLNETTSTTNDHKAIKDLFNILNEEGYDAETCDETVYISFPDVRKSLTICDYSGISATQEIVEKIYSYFMDISDSTKRTKCRVSISKPRTNKNRSS